METTIKQAYGLEITRAEKVSLSHKFLNWCDHQEQNRFGWLAAAIGGHGCVLTPLTLFAIVLSGNIFFLWVVAIAAMGMCLVTNLAAMPTKVTIPIFLLSILIDIAIVVFCIFQGFDISGTYV